MIDSKAECVQNLHDIKKQKQILVRDCGGWRENKFRRWVVALGTGKLTLGKSAATEADQRNNYQHLTQIQSQCFWAALPVERVAVGRAKGPNWSSIHLHFKGAGQLPASILYMSFCKANWVWRNRFIHKVTLNGIYTDCVMHYRAQWLWEHPE